MNNAVADPLFSAIINPAHQNNQNRRAGHHQQAASHKQHKRQRQYPLVLVVREHFKNEYVHCFRSSR